MSRPAGRAARARCPNREGEALRRELQDEVTRHRDDGETCPDPGGCPAHALEVEPALEARRRADQGLGQGGVGNHQPRAGRGTASYAQGMPRLVPLDRLKVLKSPDARRRLRTLEMEAIATKHDVDRPVMR